MKKLARIVTGITILIFASTSFAYSHVFWLSTIKYSDFNNISKKLYVDPALKKSEYKAILDLIYEAKERIRNKYGSFGASPVIVITATAKNARKYGLGVFPAKAFALPWEEYVVVSNQTHSLDLLSHELMHAQMREVLGYWRYRKIPTWFDEGVAMQVDYRERYKVEYKSFSPQEMDRVKKLDSPALFWTDSKEQDIKNYRAAKAAVQEILSIYSSKSLYSLLLKIRKGEKFISLFSQIRSANEAK